MLVYPSPKLQSYDVAFADEPLVKATEPPVTVEVKFTVGLVSIVTVTDGEIDAQPLGCCSVTEYVPDVFTQRPACCEPLSQR